MKTLFIEARCKEKFLLPIEVISKLPKQQTLATTVQFIDSVGRIKKQLEQSKIKVRLAKGKHSKYDCQMLGCDIDKANDENYLYIGDGEFHPKALLLKGAKNVWAFNPFTRKLTEIKQADIENIKRKTKAALTKFYSSKNIGVIITKKPGQNRLKDAIDFKAKWESNVNGDGKEGNVENDGGCMGKKNIFLFMCDTLDFNELENFPFIECWVNTMCPRIGYDDSLRLKKAIINIDELA